MNTVWPKQVIKLTPEQEQIKSDWENFWLNEGIKKYSFVEKFNETFFSRVQITSTAQSRVLEIGPGKGNFIQNYLGAGEEYYCVERRQEFCNELATILKPERVICGDVQNTIPLPDSTFDRVIAIHILEHLPNLPAALAEVRRLLKPKGFLDIVIPCEGAMVYSLGRKFSSERAFKRKFKTDFAPIIKSDHVNTAKEIIAELQKEFKVEHRYFFPFNMVPFVDVNLLIGLRLSKRPESAR